MPRLTPAIAGAVLFLYARHPEKCPDATPVGTGFVVGFPNQNNPAMGAPCHIYAVTCHHVGPRASFIRINTEGGGSRVIDTEPAEWQFLSDSDDVAAIDITDEIASTDEYAVIRVETFVTKQIITDLELGLGEDGFMLGLFANHPGAKRNLVASRFGNVSLLADEDEPVKQGNDILRPSHLFDMRSRTGFSGSPVFVYRTPSSDLRFEALARKRTQGHRSYAVSRDDDVVGYNARAQHDLESWIEETDNGRNIFLRLLGMHSAQLREPLTVFKESETNPPTLNEDGVVRHGDKLSIQSSMTVIVPAWRIIDLLQHKNFDGQRKAREMREAKNERLRVQPESNDDTASPSAPTPASEAELDHQEAFNRLVAKAATAKPKDDRT